MLDGLIFSDDLPFCGRLKMALGFFLVFDHLAVDFIGQ
jgi:hypothetical protein